MRLFVYCRGNFVHTVVAIRVYFASHTQQIYRILAAWGSAFKTSHNSLTLEWTARGTRFAWGV